MSLKIREYTCEYQQCGLKFQHRVEGERKYRFCSRRCAYLAKRKISAEMLIPYVESGTKTWKIAAELKIAPSALLTALRRHGLYSLWCERRYKKCASQMAGVPLMTTRSETAIGRSAESSPLTV